MPYTTKAKVYLSSISDLISNKCWNITFAVKSYALGITTEPHTLPSNEYFHVPARSIFIRDGESGNIAASVPTRVGLPFSKNLISGEIGMNWAIPLVWREKIKSANCNILRWVILRFIVLIVMGLCPSVINYRSNFLLNKKLSKKF